MGSCCQFGCSPGLCAVPLSAARSNSQGPAAHAGAVMLRAGRWAAGCLWAAKGSGRGCILQHTCKPKLPTCCLPDTAQGPGFTLL